MFDLKVDISPIILKYPTMLMVASLVGLITYNHYWPDQSWTVPTIVGILVLLVLSFFVWIYNLRKQKEHEDAMAKAIFEQRRSKMVKEAQETLCFFRSLDDFCQDAAVALYRHPQRQNQCFNERYVAFGELLQHSMYFDRFTSYSSYPNKSYIWCTNELESMNGGVRHYEITPLFYAILENYANNGIDDYPEGYDIMQYAYYYGI